MRQTETNCAKINENFSDLLADAAEQPGPGIGPLTVQRALREPQTLCDLLVTQAPEEFHHHNPLQFWVFDLEPRQCLVHQQNLVIRRRLRQLQVLDIQASLTAAM